MIEVIRLAGAEADIQAVYERLEDVRAGAGDRFLRELDRCASLVARYPSIDRRHRGPFRKLLVSGYPYGVFYAIQPSRAVIVAVLDLRQEPEAINKRLGP